MSRFRTCTMLATLALYAGRYGFCVLDIELRVQGIELRVQGTMLAMFAMLALYRQGKACSCCFLLLLRSLAR